MISRLRFNIFFHAIYYGENNCSMRITLVFHMVIFIVMWNSLLNLGWCLSLYNNLLVCLQKALKFREGIKKVKKRKEKKSCLYFIVSFWLNEMFTHFGNILKFSWEKKKRLNYSLNWVCILSNLLITPLKWSDLR